MTWTRSLRLAAVASLLALVSVTGARAADPPKADGAQAPRAHGQWMEHRLQQRLGLTDDQVKQIREIHQRQAEAGKQLFQDLRQAQADLRQLALEGGDDAALKAKMDQVEKLLGQTVEMRVKTLKEMAPILTPEQREKLAKMDYESGGARGEGRHRRDGSKQGS